MAGIFGDDGRILRDRWLRIDPTPDDTRRRGRDSSLVTLIHVTDLETQLADHRRIAPLSLVDAAWYEPRGGRMALASSFLWPLRDSGSEAHLLQRLRIAVRFGRLVPAARWNLHLPSHAYGPGDMPQLAALQLPPPQRPDPNDRPPRPLMTAASLRTMEWLRLEAGAATALLLLRPSDLLVLEGERFEPALVADVSISDSLDRPLLPVRVIASGPNRKVLADLRGFLAQIGGLLTMPRAGEDFDGRSMPA
jgi:hypothetical protein